MPHPLWSARIDKVEAGVNRVAARHPSLPAELVVLGRLIVGLGRDLAANADELLSEQALCENEWRVLMLLYGNPRGSVTAGELAASASQSPATLTRMTDALFERGLIARQPGEADRRQVEISLTRKGEALVHALLPRIIDHLHSSFAALSPTEVKRLTADLKRISRTLVDLAGAAAETEAAR
jgi:DNA-binding MarR family transcriptional regulator